MGSAGVRVLEVGFDPHMNVLIEDARNALLNGDEDQHDRAA
jgi:small nuclear ribonucleoprotein (snRNP)-like protein